jgi:hypothetical protein
LGTLQFKDESIVFGLANPEGEMGNLFWLSDEAWAVIKPHLRAASQASRASMIAA